MKVILISATGQVGYALAPALMEARHEVTVLVRDASRLPFSKSIRRVAVPEFDAEVFGRALRDVECAVYCVGLPEQFAFDTCVFDRVNRGLLTTFLSALEASAVRRLVYISTFEVFSPRHGVIRESHPMTPLAGLSPYFTAMTLAYQDVMEFASRTQTRLTTIHPAAVYCGLNTGDGFTGVIENLLNWRVWRLPAVPPGRFPLVHAGSLAEGVASALLYQGPFILSDEMCDLPTLARALRSQVRSYVPLTVPASLAYGAARPIEALGRAIHRRPLLSRVQLDFIASSSEPLADRARETFGFTPLPIEKGLSVICRNAHACWPRSLTARRPRRRRQPRTRAHFQPGHCGEAVAMNPTRLVHLGSGPKRHQLEVRRWLRRKHVLHIRLSAVDA